MRDNRNAPLTDEQIQEFAPSAFAGQPYGRQSNKYAFVPTIEVIQAMRHEGFFPVSASQSITRIADRRPFTKHMIRFRSATPVTVGDSILETVLINSHDGTSSYKLMMGVFRLVCSNGLVVADAMVDSIHIRHIGRDVTNAIVSATIAMLDKAPIVQDAINEWSNILLDHSEQLILAEAAHAVRFPADSNMATAITPESLLTVRRYADNGDSLWQVFNRIQENTINGGIRGRMPRTPLMRPRGIRTRQVTGIDQTTSLNKALWAMAEKMAELKKNG